MRIELTRRQAWELSEFLRTAMPDKDFDAGEVINDILNKLENKLKAVQK